MKFFMAEDFRFSEKNLNGTMNLEPAERMAHIANAKLLREAKVVYGSYNSVDSHGNWTSDVNKTIDTHKALLINVEPIEKCEHPINKCYWTGTYIKSTLEKNTPLFKCECGNEVTPAKFEEVK